MAFMLTVLSQWIHAQSGSTGSTFVHSGGEMGIFGQHNFQNGSGTISAGIIGSERQPAIGVYSFVNPNGSWVGASSQAFVDGYVRTYNTGAFTFPIGDNNQYRPAAVSASSSTAPTTAAYYGVDPGLATTSDLKGGTYGILPGGGPAFPTTSKDANVGTVDNVEYWDIDGTTPARITLTWDANTPIAAMVGTDLSRLRIVGWDGTKWVVIPSTIDAGSLLQNTSASAFTGAAPTVSAGSITTNATVVPGSFTVYTLAGACMVTQVIADVTSNTICAGEQVAINYTTVAPGGEVQWTRRASDGSADIVGIGNIIDFPTASGTTPVSYSYIATSAEAYGCVSNTVTTTVTVNPVPTVTPSVCSQTICSGQTGVITFTPSIPGSTIHWERTPTTPAPSSGTGNIGQTLINTGPTSLTFTYKVWAESPAPASCPSSTTITCEIVVTPGLTVTAMVATGSGCIGAPLSLSASVAPSGSYTYSWAGPNGYVGTGANPQVTTSATTTHNGSYTVTVTDAAGCSSTATVPVSVSACGSCFTPLVYLQGALVDDIGIWPASPVFGANNEPLMRDQLRSLTVVNASFPLTDPYRLTPYSTTFTHVANPYNEVITNPTATLADKGDSSVVDWVFLEFRDPTTQTLVRYTRSALVLRNGAIVEPDGRSCLRVDHISAGDYYVAVRHRNHLGVMTRTTRPINVAGTDVTVDFRTLPPSEIWDSGNPNYADHERRSIPWGPGIPVQQTYYALWGGNANRDKLTVYQGQQNDVDEVYNQVLTAPGNIFGSNSYQLRGYFSGDVNLNGLTVYQGQQNEPDIIYNIMIQHPRNLFGSNSFNIVEQLP